MLSQLRRMPELVAAVIAHELLSYVIRFVDLFVTLHGVVIAAGVVALITLVPPYVKVNHIRVIFEISAILGMESTLGACQPLPRLFGHMPRTLVLGHLVSPIGCV